MPKKNKFHQGFFIPNNPHKYYGDQSKIFYRSSWELKMMKWCDKNPSVLNWASEEIVIKYYSKADGKMRRYFMDFIIKIEKSDGTTETMIIEIKPQKETVQPVKGNKRQSTWIRESYNWMVNQDKWAAAQDFAARHDMKFIIMDEYSLGIKKSK